MRYLVRAKLKPGKAAALQQAIQTGRLGAGSVAGDEYLRNMSEARWVAGELCHWVEVCFCDTPLDEERPYWETYFDIQSLRDACSRAECRHESGQEAWACCECDCTRQLEQRLAGRGEAFLGSLARIAAEEQTNMVADLPPTPTPQPAPRAEKGN